MPADLRLALAARLRSLLATPQADDAAVSLAGRRVPLAHPLFEICQEELDASRALRARSSAPRSAIWFVPWWRHITYGGIQTIFRFISGFAARGLKPTIVIYDNAAADLPSLRSEAMHIFPNLSEADFRVFDFDRDEIDDLPAADVAVCTFWASAYLLLKYSQTAAKYYFIQDYEPLFYRPGPVSALAESTYRFGFRGIVNTPGLFHALNDRHAVDGVSFVPAVDGAAFHPPARQVARDRLRVFFFARPSQPRNAFQLGLTVIEALLERFDDKIEIVTAGAAWDERAHGLGGRITNLGLLSGLGAVGDVYRTCDIGFVYSMTKHPSYQPFEFMASGMATVVNRNEDTEWLLKDGINCLVAEPSPAAMAEKIAQLIEDPGLREAIAQGGLASVGSDWEAQLNIAWNYVSSGV